MCVTILEWQEMIQPDAMEPARTSAAKVLQDCLSGNWTTQVIYAMAELSLADHVADAPRTSGQLAALTHTHEPSLQRLLRALVALGAMTESANGCYASTEMGQLLRTGTENSLRSWARWWGRSLAPAWGELLHSLRTGESARRQLTGADGFDHLTHDPVGAEIFYQATVELARLSAADIVAACDLATVRSIVDVGGGYGELLVWLLRANLQARGILVELPQALAGARQHLRESAVNDRCDAVAGDFFVSIPANADAYLLANVLHNWSDDRAQVILTVCRAAMRTDSRLIVVEQVLSEPGDTRSLKALALSDLTMLVAHGAAERNRESLRGLLAEAGLGVLREAPVGSTSRLFEATRMR
jgi:orsellinic acid C2-O-methyltransferase